MIFLDVWQSIRDFFISIFQKVSWSSVFTLFAGIAIGVTISVLVYVILLLRNINKKEKQNKFDESNIVRDDYDVQLDLIKKYIKASKDEFHEVSTDMTLSQKIDVTKELTTNLVVNIAKIYYPDSTHPLCELSVTELMQLDYYICHRIESIFDGKVLRNFKNVKISYILRLIDAKNKVEDSKIVKSAKKLKIGGIGAVLKSAMNFINPTFWIKKSIGNISMNIGTDRIVSIIFEIVGEETAKIYSKNAFIISEETAKLEEEIKSLENDANTNEEKEN